MFIEDHNLPRHLVLVLRPSSVADHAAYLSWLQRFAAATPANVRAIVVDSQGDNPFGSLAASLPERVLVESAGLEMSAALLELCQRAGGGADATPGGRFRIEFLRMCQALREGVTPRALALAQSAAATAAATGTDSLVVAVHFTLAAALAGAGQGEAARVRYAQAESCALQADTSEPAERETARRLRLQARLGLGATFIADAQWEQGAAYWETTAQLALADGELAVALDAYRLCSFCHEQRPTPDEAWRTALEGLQLARRLEPPARSVSSFAHLCEAITRLSHAQERSEAGELAREIEMLSRPAAEA
jgi:hypothetical protein